MRQWIDLCESSMTPSVFHGTFTGRALKIIDTNAILPNTKHDSTQLLLSKEKELVKGISTSRNINFALYYATGVVFELDLLKLKQKYRVIPTDFYGYRPEGKIRKTTRSESEEFILTNKPLPLNPYLIAVHMLQKRWNAIQNDSAFDELTRHPLLKIVGR